MGWSGVIEVINSVVVCKWKITFLKCDSLINSNNESTGQMISDKWWIVNGEVNDTWQGK